MEVGITDMDYRKLVENMLKGCEDCEYRNECREDETRECAHRLNAATAITDLLARAEAAEARVRELETSFRTEKCENGPECVELGRVRKALAEAEARAEKEERERDAAISVLQNLRDSALTAISEYEKNQKQKYGQKEE